MRWRANYRLIGTVNRAARSDGYFRSGPRSVTLGWLSVMGFLGIALFLLVFLMIGSGSRALITNVFAGAGDWIAKYAPLSYMILAVIVIVPVVAAIVVMKWPEPPEPENPLARFKHEDVVD